jgi:hypothetical protein
MACLPLGSEAEFLGEIQTKVLRVFLLAIHSHLYSFALRFLFLQTHAISYSFYSSVTVLYTVKEKGGKPDRKPYPLPFGLRNPHRNPKSENSQDYAQNPQRNCTFMNSAPGLLLASLTYLVSYLSKVVDQAVRSTSAETMSSR